MSYRFGFVIVMEKGELEAKTTLLVESIRRLPSLQTCPIFVVQPRAGELPSHTSASLLARLNSHYIYADLNKTWRHHGPMNKVYASALVEPYVEDTVETLLFLDSDLLFVTEPDGLALQGEEIAAVAPIAQQRVGKVGQLVEEPLNGYWQMIYDACGVKGSPEWFVTTTIDHRRILPYFNSGVVAVRPTAGIFRKWQENVERVAKDPRSQQYGEKSREFFFLDQTMLAGTLTAELAANQIRVMDHHFNYPLPAHNLLPSTSRVSHLEEISILHYHAAFSNLYWMDDIQVAEPLASWLLSRLPLRPKLRMNRSAILYFTSHWLSRLPGRRQHHQLIRHLPGLHKTLPTVVESQKSDQWE